MNTPNAGFTIGLRFGDRPSISMIACSRRFVQELYEPMVGPDASSRVAMVVHELAENLTKYAADGPVRMEIDLFTDPEQGQLVRISATNAVTRPRLETLKAVLDELSTSSDSRATYLEYMNRSLSYQSGSGLGLARILAEGEMKLHYTNTDNEITIHAEAPMPRST